MIQVIKTAPKQTTLPFKDLKFEPNKFYGVQVGMIRGYITKYSYCEDDFTIKILDSFSEGNGIDAYDKNSFGKIVATLLNKGQHVFIFDSFIELANWLAAE